MRRSAAPLGSPQASRRRRAGRRGGGAWRAVPCPRPSVVASPSTRGPAPSPQPGSTPSRRWPQPQAPPGDRTPSHARPSRRRGRRAPMAAWRPMARRARRTARPSLQVRRRCRPCPGHDLDGPSRVSFGAGPGRGRRPAEPAGAPEARAGEGSRGLVAPPRTAVRRMERVCCREERRPTSLPAGGSARARAASHGEVAAGSSEPPIRSFGCRTDVPLVVDAKAALGARALGSVWDGARSSSR